MLKVLLYTNQPMLVLGIEATLCEGECELARVCTTLPMVMEALSHERFGVLLLDATPEINVEALGAIRDLAQGTPMILWVDSVATEFISMAVGLGVRGVLRKNLSPELLVRCLKKVGEGELWVEKELVASLLTSKRIGLTPRELQLAGLLAQGLKNKEIAYRLGLGEGTVKVYFSRMFVKVGVTDRFEMALYAIERLFGGRCPAAEEEKPVAPARIPTSIPGACLTPNAGTHRYQPGVL